MIMHLTTPSLKIQVTGEYTVKTVKSTRELLKDAVPHFQPGQQRGPEPRRSCRWDAGTQSWGSGATLPTAGVRCHQPPALPSCSTLQTALLPLCTSLQTFHSAAPQPAPGMHADPGPGLLPPPCCRWCRTIESPTADKGHNHVHEPGDLSSLPCWSGAEGLTSPGEGRREAEHHPRSQVRPIHHSQTKAHGKGVTMWRDRTGGCSRRQCVGSPAQEGCKLGRQLVGTCRSLPFCLPPEPTAAQHCSTQASGKRPARDSGCRKQGCKQAQGQVAISLSPHQRQSGDKHRLQVSGSSIAKLDFLFNPNSIWKQEVNSNPGLSCTDVKC